MEWRNVKCAATTMTKVSRSEWGTERTCSIVSNVRFTPLRPLARIADVKSWDMARRRVAFFIVAPIARTKQGKAKYAIGSEL